MFPKCNRMAIWLIKIGTSIRTCHSRENEIFKAADLVNSHLRIRIHDGLEHGRDTGVKISRKSDKWRTCSSWSLSLERDSYAPGRLWWIYRTYKKWQIHEDIYCQIRWRNEESGKIKISWQIEIEKSKIEFLISSVQSRKVIQDHHISSSQILN